MVRYKLFLLMLFSLSAGKIVSQLPAQNLPDFEFFRLNKTPFTNNDLPKEKMLFFVFFDSDCDHCQHAVKNIDQQYVSFKKAAVYLISTDDKDKINRFINTSGQHLKNQTNVVLLQDNLNQFVAKFKPLKYPSMFLYSAKKKLIQYEDNEESVFRFFKPILGK